MSTPQPNPPRLDPIAAGTEACDCCAGIERETPLAVQNRPGLSAIAYRIGTYAQFRASLQAGLSSSDFPALAQLRTRDDDDFTIGLLDAVACAADVLTFYQERLANESYLRTAREQVSLQEMARLIGYRLRPGVAAETWLAFTVETPPTPPAGATPEPGMFVTGVPPQVTLDVGLAVRSVPPPGAQAQVFETVEAVTARPEWNAMQPWMSEVRRPLAGDTGTYLSGVSTDLRAGDAMVFLGDEFLADNTSNNWDFRVLTSVVADSAQNRTLVTWARPLGSLSPPKAPAATPRAYALRRRAAVYGHNAPAWGAMPTDFKNNYENAFPRVTGTPSLYDFIVTNPDWPRLAISPQSGSVDLDAVYADVAPHSFVVLATGGFNYPSEPAPAGTAVELYTVSAVTEVSRQEFGLSGKVTRLGLSGANYASFSDQVRGTSVFGASVFLPFAAYPVATPVADTSIPVSVSTDGLEPGRQLLVRGTQTSDGASILHAATLVSATPAGDSQCTLVIDPPLAGPLVRSTVVVYGNVARASHGETVTQILGAGNAAVPFQQFELKQLPLTYRAAATELGAKSELTVRVDNIAWSERDSLFGTRPRDRVFTLLSDEQDRDFVLFGDGVCGARPSSGVNNVRATYRKGLGVAGNVAAQTLTQLTSRPLGLKGVTNPQAAEGGTDPDDSEQARQSMPLMTRTLGRAVSVLDYEDFARAYSGVAKAHAQVLELHTGLTVVVTIAGPDGTVITPDSPIWINLYAALLDSGDPHVAVRLLPHRASTFHVGLRVKPDPAYEQTAVFAAVEASLRTAFGFEARSLAQPVQQSEVIAVAQAVPGVVAVDLDLLYGGTAPPAQAVPSLQLRLLSSSASVVAGEPVADELLTLDPRPLDHLTVMS